MAITAKVTQIEVYHVEEDDDLHVDVTYKVLDDPMHVLTASIVATPDDGPATLATLEDTVGQTFLD